MKYIPLIFALLILTACTGKEAAKQLITVSPSSAVVKMDTTAQFTVSPPGASVTWGIKNDSEPLLGVIDSSGSYKAPSDPATAPEKVVITATDSSGTTGSATVFLTTFNSNKRLTENYAKGAAKADTYSSGQKCIAAFKDGDGNVNIYTVWADNSLGNSQNPPDPDISQIWFSKSSDNGATFSQPETVAESLSAKQISPSIAIDSNSNAYIVWEETAGDDTNILLRVFDGTGFSSILNVNSETVIGSIDEDSSPSISFDSTGNIYIVWEHRSSPDDKYPDIYIATSTDQGQTFSFPVTLTSEGRRPSIAVNSSGVAYVAWENLSGFPLISPTHIMISKVAGNGTVTTVQVDSLIDTISHARFPSVTITPNGQKVYLVWQRAEITSPAFEKETTISYDIDLAVLDVASESISRVLSIPDSNNTGYFGGPAYPAITSDNNYIYIVWDDQRNGTKDIYFAKSPVNDPENFTTNRIVNDDLGTWHEKPSVSVLDGKGYVIWTDFRNTSGDVFFAKE